jgi:hypothetical protein
MGGRTICPHEGRVSLVFGAVDVISRNIPGAADGLTFFLCNCTVNQATVDLAADLAMTMTNLADFGLLEPWSSPPLYRGMSETNAPLNSLEFLVPQPALPLYHMKAQLIAF